ncbi:hypothetical protein CSV86_016930 [Pseudomonas putida CSV86]|uniref:Uncharacterized protein n=1 Tax=Pseudomonas bharatica CSV86 TaxID=1005395 RepID=L1M3T6_9PSED|nr:hypothetical protein [Pseudomonas bharatica]NNJ16766.1 hypothetical protein [Pseudomonas bharatica CSV86]
MGGAVFLAFRLRGSALCRSSSFAAPSTQRPAGRDGVDQAYRCTTCDLQDLDRHTDLNDKTWTCNACGNPVLIDLADDKGNTHTVERRQAQHLTDNDRVVLDHDLSLLSCI